MKSMGFIHDTEDKRFGEFELETRSQSFKVYGPRMHAHMNGEHGGVVEIDYRDLDAMLEILTLAKQRDLALGLVAPAAAPERECSESVDGFHYLEADGHCHWCDAKVD